MAFKDDVGSLDRIAKAIEDMGEAQGAGIPVPTAEDVGKVLTVDEEGKWTLANIPSQLPSVDSGDEGKVLTVSDAGEWEAADLPS